MPPPGESLQRCLALPRLESAHECAALYSCLALLRLAKAHLHFVVFCRLDLADLGLEIAPRPAADAEAPPPRAAKLEPAAEAAASWEE